MPRFDALLRLDAESQAAYELEHGAARVLHLWRVVVLGLFFYNLFNITAIYLMADVLYLSVILRLGLFTPLAMVLAWLVFHVPPDWRERLMLVGMTCGSLAPIYLFWSSADPWSSYSLVEVPLCLFFGAMVLRLRMPHLLIMTAVILPLVVAALVLKTGLPEELRLALIFQQATAGFFAIVAGYIIERQRVTEWIQTRIARAQAEDARRESRRLVKLSFTDPLTGLPNRRRFDMEAEAYISSGEAFGLIMIDVDFFKSFNDTQGHQKGDLCLQLVAQALDRAANRARGMVARIGGEEFAMLFACETEADLRRTCRSVLWHVQTLRVPHSGRADRLNHVTVSAGSTFVAEGQSIEHSYLMSLADQALYLSKERGRNTYAVVNAEGEVEDEDARRGYDPRRASP